VDPRVLEAAAIASLAGGPEVGTAAWVGRLYLRATILQAIAAQGAMTEVKAKLPRELTKARVPSVTELHKHVEKMAVDGVEKSLRRAGHKVTRSGNRLTVRESS